jgi:hypothetical protein
MLAHAGSFAGALSARVDAVHSLVESLFPFFLGKGVGVEKRNQFRSPKSAATISSN